MTQQTWTICYSSILGGVIMAPTRHGLLGGEGH